MDVVNQINSFVGVDWSLEKITVDDDVVIRLADERGYQVVISCCNFIGFSYVGHWDEGIIEYVRVDLEGDLINRSLQEIRRFYGDSPLSEEGGKKIDTTWYQLNIKLIDGIIISVVCDSLDLKIL